jgi:ribosomal protein S18 acetylase RimI-like enzyme
MLPTSIRRATPADAAALAAFAAAVFPLGCPETAAADLAAYIADELPPARFHALLEDPNVIILLAEACAAADAAERNPPELRKRIVAYMVVVRRSAHPSLPAPAAAEFRKLYLDPAYHGTGLASALVHCALSILNAEGPRPIWLSVFSQNSRAIAFYKKWGFQIAGTQEFLVGTDRQKDFLMQRDPQPLNFESCETSNAETSPATCPCSVKP